MSDFDRELAKCIGNTVAGWTPLSREVVTKCYHDTLRKLGSQENKLVSEKWIDYVWKQIEELKMGGENSEQIAEGVFEKIAKT